MKPLTLEEKIDQLTEKVDLIVKAFGLNNPKPKLPRKETRQERIEHYKQAILKSHMKKLLRKKQQESSFTSV